MRSNLLAQLLGSALVVSVGEGDVVSAFGKGQGDRDPIPPVPPLTKACVLRSQCLQMSADSKPNKCLVGVPIGIYQCAKDRLRLLSQPD